MARPRFPTPRLRSRTLRIPVDLDDRLAAWIKGTGYSRTAVMLLALTTGIDTLEKWQAGLNSARVRAPHKPRKMGQGRLK